MKAKLRTRLWTAGLLLLCFGFVLLLIHPRFAGARWAARVTQSRNNLRQIGLAAYNYHDNYLQLPFATADSEDERVAHSWQTLLLPYLDASNLHSQIDFLRRWKDPVNRQVFETPYFVFTNPCEHPPDPVDGYATSHYAANSKLMQRDSGIRLSDITDGTSLTILAGEVSTGLKAWGDPGNARDPSNGLGNTALQFGRTAPAGTYFLMADGSVLTIYSDVLPDVLRSLATPAGGEFVPAEF